MKRVVHSTVLISKLITTHLVNTLGVALLGALFIFSFAPFYQGMLAIILPVIVLIITANLTSGQTFRRSWWFSFGYFVAAVYWIYFSMHVYYQVPLIATIAIIVGLASYLALFPALAFWLSKKYSSKSKKILLRASSGDAEDDSVLNITISSSPYCEADYKAIKTIVSDELGKSRQSKSKQLFKGRKILVAGVSADITKLIVDKLEEKFNQDIIWKKSLFGKVSALSKNSKYSTTGILLLLPAFWLIFEWLRSWLLSGFPWLAIGYSQSETILANYAPVMGVYGIGWLVVTLGAIVYLLFAAQARILYAVLAVFSVSALLGADLLCWIILAGILVYGLWLKKIYVIFGALLVLGALALSQLDWSKPSGNPLSIRLVQGNIHQGIKWTKLGKSLSASRYKMMSENLGDADLVIWPETAIPAFLDEIQAGYIRELQQGLKDKNASLLLGIPVASTREVRGKAKVVEFNSIIKLTADSLIRYDKTHLVPFGEFMPFESVLGDFYDVFNVPGSDFAAGDTVQKPIVVKGHTIGINICYEIAFGREMAKALPGAVFFINFSISARFLIFIIYSNSYLLRCS